MSQAQPDLLDFERQPTNGKRQEIMVGRRSEVAGVESTPYTRTALRPRLTQLGPPSSGHTAFPSPLLAETKMDFLRIL